MKQLYLNEAIISQKKQLYLNKAIISQWSNLSSQWSDYVSMKQLCLNEAYTSNIKAKNPTYVLKTPFFLNDTSHL